MRDMNTPTGRSMTRRGFVATSVSAVVGVGLTACGSSAGGSAKGGEITMLTWETYHDKPWLAEYQRETGVKVNSVVVGSADEMFARARSGSIKPDLLFFDSGAIPRFMKAGLISPIDLGKVSNAANVTEGLDWKRVNTVDGELMGLPYNWGTQPLMYDKRAVTPAPTSWDALWDPRFKGKVVMFDDAYTTFPMLTLRIGAKDPYNLTDAEFEACRAALKDLRPQLKTIAKGYDDAVNIFAAGDGVIGYCQNISEIYALQAKDRPFDYTFPREGTPQWTDNFVLGKDGGRKEVYDFINANLTPDWQRRFVEASSNNGVLSFDAAKQAGMSSKALRQTNIADQRDASFWEKMVTFRPPEDIDRRLELWNEFKAGA